MPACSYCGGPLIGGDGTIVNGIWYHVFCPSSSRFEPMPPDQNGCSPAPHLTELDVRRIVREELAAQEGKPS